MFFDIMIGLCAVWLLFLGVVIETNNTRSKIILELPCYGFSFVLGLYTAKAFGLI